MSSEIVAAIIGALIGGFLSGACGWGTELLKENRNKENMLALFSTAMMDDLQNSIQLYEKLKDDWEKSSLIWLVTINELRKSRKIFEKHNDKILLFKCPKLRSRISKYYLKSENLISTLEIMQSRKYAIDNKYNEISLKIKNANPKLSDKKIQELIIKQLGNEANEWQWLNNNIPKSISKIDALILEAQNLIDKLDITVST